MKEYNYEEALEKLYSLTVLLYGGVTTNLNQSETKNLLMN